MQDNVIYIGHCLFVCGVQTTVPLFFLRLAALVSRQYVDMSRIRIEGLLAAFPKLVGSGKQHTYVETENVRYVYQPMEVRWGCLAQTAKENQLLFRQHNPRC